MLTRGPGAYSLRGASLNALEASICLRRGRRVCAAVVTPPFVVPRRLQRSSCTTGEVQAPTSGRVLRVGDTFSFTHEAFALGALLYVRAGKIRFELVDLLFQDCDGLIGRRLPRLCVFLDFTHPLALPLVQRARERPGDPVKAAQQLGYFASSWTVGPGRRERLIKYLIKHYTVLTVLTFFPSPWPTAPGGPAGDPPAACRGEVPCPYPALTRPRDAEQHYGHTGIGSSGLAVHASRAAANLGLPPAPGSAAPGGSMCLRVLR
jgi:hypothetical protein